MDERQKKKIATFAIILGIVLLMFVVLLFVQNIKLHDLEKRKEKLDAQNTEQNTQIEAQDREIAATDPSLNPGYADDYARQELGFGGDNDCLIN